MAPTDNEGQARYQKKEPTTDNNEKEIVTLLQPRADSSKDGYRGRQRRAYEPGERQTSNESIQNEVEKKKGKRCWNSYSWSQLKSQCPFIRRFYFGEKGHIKKRCFQLDQHKAIQVLKGIETEGETIGDVKKIKEENKFQR